MRSTAIFHIRFLGALLALISLVLVSSGDANGQPAAGQPLQVFILAGQSNMQGHAHIRTMDAMRLSPNTKPLLDAMTGPDGQPKVLDDVWISSIGSSKSVKHGKLTAGYGAEARGPKIGPEFTFGITMRDHVDGPILIIKTAWGGKSINTDFRPPGSGPYPFNESQLAQFEKQGKDIDAIKADKAAATGVYYRQMMEHVQTVLGDLKSVVPDYDPASGYELAGFVWFQGWNDMVDGGTYPNRDQPGGYDQYTTCMAQFIRDVRQELQSPQLPFVIGVLGVNGPTDKYGPDQQRYIGVHQNFRSAMAAPASMPEFQDNVAAVLTENYWDQELVQLRRREREQLGEKQQAIREQMKAGTLSRDEGQAALDGLDAETFADRERELLRESTSNAEYHYLGSARIMAQIGKGFADAMAELMDD